MISTNFSRSGAIAVLALSLTVPAAASAGQQRPVVEREAAQAAPVIISDQDAGETREKLEDLLKKLPPAVGRVLRTDPSLLRNESYLATYPALAAFVKQHPEIMSSPAFYFERIGSIEFWQPERQESQAYRIWRDFIQFFAIAGMFTLVTGTLIWIIRTLVEYRRWHRISKVHTEVHNKLMDRFTANEDLLAYMQTPAAQRFLESAPLPIDSPSRPVGAPFSRILWSVQVGVVLAAGALGLLYVSGRVIDEVSQPLFAVGVLALTIGAGFVVSAGASFLLSRRLGLLETPVSPREHIENAGR